MCVCMCMHAYVWLACMCMCDVIEEKVKGKMRMTGVKEDQERGAFINPPHGQGACYHVTRKSSRLFLVT